LAVAGGVGGLAPSERSIYDPEKAHHHRLSRGFGLLPPPSRSPA